MVMRFLRSLFSRGGRASEPPPVVASVEYNGYTITPAPEKEAAGWRVAGTIAKDISGDRKVYRLGRADTSPDRDAIITMTIEKAKRVIDEQGERMFQER
jgi:hypothetical protein